MPFFEALKKIRAGPLKKDRNFVCGFPTLYPNLRHVVFFLPSRNYPVIRKTFWMDTRQYLPEILNFKSWDDITVDHSHWHTETFSHNSRSTLPICKIPHCSYKCCGSLSGYWPGSRCRRDVYGDPDQAIDYIWALNPNTEFYCFFLWGFESRYGSNHVVLIEIWASA